MSDPMTADAQDREAQERVQRVAEALWLAYLGAMYDPLPSHADHAWWVRMVAEGGGAEFIESAEAAIAALAPDLADAEKRGRVAGRAELQAELDAAEEEERRDYEECRAEIWSWEIFRSEQVDPYWMRCHLLGAHDEHENSETGSTWKETR